MTNYVTLLLSSTDSTVFTYVQEITKIYLQSIVFHLLRLFQIMFKYAVNGKYNVTKTANSQIPHQDIFHVLTKSELFDRIPKVYSYRR